MTRPTKQARAGKASPAATAAAKAELLRKAQANSTKASAPIAAADVRRFNNPESVQASNGLVGSNLGDTLLNCACVAAFLSDFHTGRTGSEMNEHAKTGLVFVCDYL
jgi:hypothetical protein